MRINILGCSVDNLSIEETLSRIEEFILSGQPHQHVVVNVDKIVKADRDPQLKAIINGCQLVNVDGMPVVWASKLLGVPLKERVTGIDLFERLLEKASKIGWRVFFLGAKEDIVKRVVANCYEKYPTLQIVGYRNGYWNADEESEIVETIKRSRPDLLFVAISSPKKEHFLNKYQKEMKVPFAMGVGGAFDVLAGSMKRAPKWMQNCGMEWFYRFLQEPKRMFKRYFINDMLFFWLLIKEVFKR
jgi:N-acetylglucosaminyldiphosphoundecaprenol N-acetyl-beta-D-mannosaminyltransferase